MTMQTEPQTPEAALLWLAGLVEPCPVGLWSTKRHPGQCECAGSNEAPVLPDLRQPCPNINNRGTDAKFHHACVCKARLWIPNQGRDALYQAMHLAGWNLALDWYADGERVVCFSRSEPQVVIGPSDADDHIAAAKAMREAG